MLLKRVNNIDDSLLCSFQSEGLGTWGGNHSINKSIGDPFIHKIFGKRVGDVNQSIHYTYIHLLSLVPIQRKGFDYLARAIQ